MMCGTPCLICGLVLMLALPESPKFTFSQGDETKTLRILKKIYVMNTGKSSESFDVKGIEKDEEFNNSSRSKSENFLQFMWSQSVPLFQGSHLRNILTACFLQFAICNTTNSFWTFLPEILNKITLWKSSSRGSATTCEIFNAMKIYRNETESEVIQVPICMEKLELSTFIYVFELCILYAGFYALFSLLINRTGKLAILLGILVTCGSCAFLLMFVTIPTVSSYLYLTMLLSGLGISIVNASTVELFPTKMR